jgi:hypothetical protein
MMLKRIACLAAVAALLLVAPGAGSLAGQRPGDPAAGQEAEPSPSAEAVSADTTRGEEEPEPVPAEAESGEAEEGEAPVELDATEDEAAEPPGGVAPSGLRVFRAYICKGIEQSEPTEAGKSFIPASDGVLRLCCFSEVGGGAAADTVFHVWYWGEREMARVPLRVEGARWRTWSTKRIIDEWRGDWRVDIIDRDAFLLKRLAFSVE